jgi:putative peptidoglycan lipid II flippase
MLPATAGLIAIAGPLMALLAGYGAIGAADEALLADTLRAFAIGLPFFSAFQLLTRTSYATLDSRTPALLNIGLAVLNVSAAWALAHAAGLGVPGVALSHALSYLVGTAVLAVLVRSRLGGLDLAGVAGTVLRAGAAAVLCGLAAWAAAWAIEGWLDVTRPSVRLIQVLVAVSAGVLVFLAAAFMFGVREVDDVRRTLMTRLR